MFVSRIFLPHSYSVVTVWLIKFLILFFRQLNGLDSGLGGLSPVIPHWMYLSIEERNFYWLRLIKEVSAFA